jgi:hypothetical protein
MAAAAPIIPALLTATETVPWLAPMAASTAAAAGTAGLGTAAGLGAAAGGTGGGGGLMSGLYGLLPGIPFGSEQAAMLASQTGTFGLPGLAATGNAAASAFPGTFSSAFWGGADKLLNGGRMADTLRGANMARTGMQMMQGGSPQQRQPMLPVSAPVQSGAPPQMAGNAPTPAQLAAWRRVKGREMAMRGGARGGMS